MTLRAGGRLTFLLSFPPGAGIISANAEAHSVQAGPAGGREHAAGMFERSPF